MLTITVGWTTKRFDFFSSGLEYCEQIVRGFFCKLHCQEAMALRKEQYSFGIVWQLSYCNKECVDLATNTRIGDFSNGWHQIYFELNRHLAFKWNTKII